MVLTEAAQAVTRLKMPCTIERGNSGYVVDDKLFADEWLFFFYFPIVHCQ